MNSKLNNAKNNQIKLGVINFIQGEKGREFPPQSLKNYTINSISASSLEEYINNNPANVIELKLEGNEKEKKHAEAEIEDK